MRKAKRFKGIEFNGTVVRNNPKKGIFTVSVKKRDNSFKCIDAVLAEDVNVKIGDYVMIKCNPNSQKAVIIEVLKSAIK